ncbi:MAG: SDR family NAD(P)-dependent oxidoreductase, partial [Stackebrandtia sp.]
MTASTLVIGAGPGLGMSIAHRFGREGKRVALLSRSAKRHAGYLEQLSAAGIDATAHAADIRDPGQLAAALADIIEQHPG